MGQAASSCKLDSSADPNADTVKVNPTLLSGSTDAGMKDLRQQEGQENEEKLRLEAEEERLPTEQERLQAEQERLRAEEERRRTEEEEARTQAEEEARRQAELARKKAEEEEAERQRIEAARLEEEAAEARRKFAQEQEEIAAGQKAVDDFLKAHGFKQLSLPKKAICGAPLSAIHMAVEKNNPDLVRAMVRGGADLNQKGPGKKTPLEFAEQCNKGGSHDAVVKALRGES